MRDKLITDSSSDTVQYNVFSYAESFKKVIDTYETLDILVNIAGIMDDADWEIMVDVNYVSQLKLF